MHTAYTKNQETESKRNLISSTVLFYSLGSVFTEICVWGRTQILAIGRSLYSLNLVSKKENGRAKQAGRFDSMSQAENIPAEAEHKAKPFLFNHALSTSALSKPLFCLSKHSQCHISSSFLPAWSLHLSQF